MRQLVLDYVNASLANISGNAYFFVMRHFRKSFPFMLEDGLPA